MRAESHSRYHWLDLCCDLIVLKSQFLTGEVLNLMQVMLCDVLWSWSFPRPWTGSSGVFPPGSAPSPAWLYACVTADTALVRMLISSYTSLSLVSETSRYLNSSTWGTSMIQTWLDQRAIFQQNIMASDILPHVVFNLSHIWCSTTCVVYPTAPFTASSAPSPLRSVFPLFHVILSCPSCRVSSPCLPPS